MLKRLLIYRYFFLLLPLLPSQMILASVADVRGRVIDKSTRKPISYVSVYVKEVQHGDMSNEKGEFELKVDDNQTIVASCIGYKEYTASASRIKEGKLLIQLEPLEYELSEVTIRPGKERYRKKDNPAVDFIKNVIDNRKKSDPRHHDYFSYEKYERFTYALNNFDSTRFEKGLYKRFKFAKQYLDTSLITGKQILNVSLREKIEQNYYRKNPHSLKRVVEATKNNGIDELMPQQGMEVLFSEVFKEVDIYDNDIDILTNRFVSPISDMGPSFYKYYLMDTVYIDGIKCQDVGFVPMNSMAAGFNGHLYVTLDSTFFVKKVRMNFGKEININFIDFLQIDQEFERDSKNTRLITKDDMVVEFAVLPGIPEIYARRMNSYREHSFTEPVSTEVFSYQAETTELVEAAHHDEEYWVKRRHTPVTPKENSVADLMQGLRSVPFFYYTEKVLSILVAGYIPSKMPDGKFLYGPMNTSFSHNSLEGFRLRTGGMTTAFLNKRLFAYGYAAYGLSDETLKYMGQVEYSFHDKKEHANEFPIHSIKARYSYDINELGQKYLTNSDNFVLSIKRKQDNRTTYLRTAEVGYQREFHSGLSYALQFRHMTEYATRFVSFNKMLTETDIRSIDSYRVSEAQFNLRYAPHEKFYQMKTKRVSMTPHTPVFTFSHIYAPQGELGSDFGYNRTDIGFEKRFWLSAFGYIDAYLKAGKVWDKAPFTQLCIPNANLSYTNQPQSFSLVNPVEFINDEYASWDLTYFLNGFVLNRMPVIKKLKWREVLTFRGIYGRLSDKNNPEKNQGLLEFPENTYLMKKTPYMECGVGIENVFKVLRFDYIWRLTYLDHPNIDKRGLRVSMHVSF